MGVEVSLKGSRGRKKLKYRKFGAGKLSGRASRKGSKAPLSGEQREEVMGSTQRENFFSKTDFPSWNSSVRYGGKKKGSPEKREKTTTEEGGESVSCIGEKEKKIPRTILPKIGRRPRKR